LKKITFLLISIIVVAGLAACSQATPETIIETVEVEKVVTVEVEKEVAVEKVVTVEVEKEVAVVEQVEVTRVVVEEVEVPVVETVEVEKVVAVAVTSTPTPLPTATPTPVWENVAQQLILREITFVQDHGESKPFRFSCAGNGIYGVQDFASTLSLQKGEVIFIIPNAGNLDLWGETAGFRISGDNTVELVPRSSRKFQDSRDGQLYESLSLNEALDLATAGYLRWIGGQHGDAGLVAKCDPQYQAE
jgi:hypothetical protein